MSSVNLLFVYGTLMSSQKDKRGAAACRKLAGEAVIIGPAVIRGTLFDIGDYPGVVPTNDSNVGFVTGEVVRVVDPPKTFSWLDAYEGEEYDRTVHPVMIDGSGWYDAWVYNYIAPLDGRTVIGDGRWIGMTQQD